MSKKNQISKIPQNRIQPLISGFLCLKVLNLCFHSNQFIMIHFFGGQANTLFAVQTTTLFSEADIQKLRWLFNCPADAITTKINLADALLIGHFVGPRAAMITPWSTNAVEITQNRSEEHTSELQSQEHIS